MEGWWQPALLLLAVLSASSLKTINNRTEEGNSTRGAGRFLNLFSVIRFSNIPCLGTDNRNGTCYTEKQCRERSGTLSGTCAGGFGVCCVFSIGCGDTSSENSTYVTTELVSSECSYKICRCNPTVSTIRLDFYQFDISQPFVCGSSSDPVTCTIQDGPRFGDCIYDSFSVTSPGGQAPPVICGYNTGQHMYVDSSQLCNRLTFNFDPSLSAYRQWQIKITQYDEMDDARYLPPPDCLQYFTGTLGSVQNFNYKNSDSYHLSSQRYTICWRRERNRCALCVALGYFGMSNVPSKVPSTSTSSWTKKAGFTDSICCEADTPTANCGTSGANDFIEFDNAMEPPTNDRFKVGQANRFCGRWMGVNPEPVDSYTYSATNAGKTICSSAIPFRMRVRFSDGEELGSSPTTICSSSRPAKSLDVSDECATFRTYGKRRGTLGFQLTWWQTTCPSS